MNKQKLSPNDRAMIVRSRVHFYGPEYIYDSEYMEVLKKQQEEDSIPIESRFNILDL